VRAASSYVHMLEYRRQHHQDDAVTIDGLTCYLAADR
jgi:hypothetical protein